MNRDSLRLGYYQFPTISSLSSKVGQLRGASLRQEMKEIGSALTSNSSAVVAVIEHSSVSKLEDALAAAEAQVIRDLIKADIAEPFVGLFAVVA